MKKNIRSSSENIKKKYVVLTTEKEEKNALFDGFFHSLKVRSLTNLSKKIVRYPVKNGSKNLLLSSRGNQENKEKNYFKIIKDKRLNLFYIESSSTIYNFYTHIVSDLKPTLSFFSNHEFNPYFEAFISAQEQIEKHKKLGQFFNYLPEKLTDKCTLEEAKAMWYVCYLAVKTIKNFTAMKGFITATNDFEKPVRQNAKSLESYLKKLGKRYRKLAIIHQNISLTDTVNLNPNEKTQSRHEATLAHHAFLHMDQKIFTNAKIGSASDSLYQILKNSRTAHIKNIQNHPNFGSLMAGYIWRLNYNGFASWSYDLVIFFDLAATPNMPQVQLKGSCDQLWLRLCQKEQIVRQGLTSLILEKELPTTLEFNTKEYNDSIQQLVSTLIRTDYLLRVVAPDKGRTFGKGQA